MRKKIVNSHLILKNPRLKSCKKTIKCIGYRNIACGLPTNSFYRPLPFAQSIWFSHDLMIYLIDIFALLYSLSIIVDLCNNVIYNSYFLIFLIPIIDYYIFIYICIE